MLCFFTLSLWHWCDQARLLTEMWTHHISLYWPGSQWRILSEEGSINLIHMIERDNVLAVCIKMASVSKSSETSSGMLFILRAKIKIKPRDPQFTETTFFPSLFFLNFELHFFTSLGTLIFHDSSEIIQKISQLYLQISLNFLESNFIPYSLMFELCFLVCRSFFFEKTEVKQGLRNFMFSVVSEFRCGLNVSRCHLL